MKNKVALFRLSVLGSLTSRIDVQHGELKKAYSSSGSTTI